MPGSHRPASPRPDCVALATPAHRAVYALAPCQPQRSLCDAPPVTLKRALRLPIAIAAALVAVTSALAPATALADKVKLKTGQVITGRVQDRGSYVIVERELDVMTPLPRASTRTAGLAPTGTAAAVTTSAEVSGVAAEPASSSGTAAPAAGTVTADPRRMVAARASIRIERSEIESIEIDGQAPRPPRDLDVVVFASGDELAGHVEIRNEGKDIVIVGDGDRGEVTLDSRQVRTILWSTKSAEDQARGDSGAGTVIQKVLADLSSSDEAVKKAAVDRVHELGIYALPYLESRVDDSDPSIRKVIRSVIEVARLKMYMTRPLGERVPQLPRRLVEGDEAARLQVLKEAVVASPEDIVPILVHLARTDPSGAVRAFVLGQLTLMNRSKELLELLDAHDGGLRFAAALALGDNGVLVGIPLVIEGLSHTELSIRKISIQKLEAWTGQFLGYFADEPAEKRALSVKRWEEWLAKDGKEVIQQSLKNTIRGGDVTEADKIDGIANWTAAQQVWDAIILAGLEGESRTREMQKVRFALEKSLSYYPQNVTARIGLATVLYVELDDKDAATRELELVLRRYEDSSGDPARLQAHFHLGRIKRLEKKMGEAEKHYKLALTIDASNIDARRDLAALEWERGISEENLTRPERKHLFEDAVVNLTAALAAVDAYQLDLSENVDKAAEGIALARPFDRGKFMASVDRVRSELRRVAAEIRFLRGRSYAALLKDPEAFADYIVALELDPENPLYQGAVNAWNPKNRPAPKKPEK